MSKIELTNSGFKAIYDEKTVRKNFGNYLAIFKGKEKSMSRTKEIEVYINREELKHFAKENNHVVVWSQYPAALCAVKARLIVELPDRKVELTEAQFDEAVNNCEVFSPGNDRWVHRDNLKAKIFGEEGK